MPQGLLYDTMTTYTKISDEERPCISIDPSFTISEIDDNVYGGFTEYALSSLLVIFCSRLTGN